MEVGWTVCRSIKKYSKILKFRFTLRLSNFSLFFYFYFRLPVPIVVGLLCVWSVVVSARIGTVHQSQRDV